jgi:hypothetical protein
MHMYACQSSEVLVHMYTRYMSYEEEDTCTCTLVSQVRSWYTCIPGICHMRRRIHAHVRLSVK